MISVNQAKKIIEDNTVPLPWQYISLEESTGCALAESVYSEVDVPSFPQSSMDGYAIAYTALLASRRAEINGEIAAGSVLNGTLPAGQAVRIFTGAAVPDGADTVIKQEDAIVQNNQLLFPSARISKGDYIRQRGEEISRGQLVFPKGKVLTPPAIGVLASIGIGKVPVYPAPRIALVITGSELISPGNALAPGRLYDVNSFTLRAALQAWLVHQITILHVKDDPGELRAIIQGISGEADLVLLTGGVSVGKYDFVVQALSSAGVETLFHRVKQKPGKPLYFGKRGHTLFFGLPGNPASVLTCFYEYVTLALAILTQRKKYPRPAVYPLATAYVKPAGLTCFLKGRLEDDLAFPLIGQESYRLSSFAEANCLIRLEEEKTAYAAGDEVEVHLFP